MKPFYDTSDDRSIRALLGNDSKLASPSRVLRIASHPAWYPESGECALDGFNRRKKCLMPGYGPEVLDLILKYSGIQYEIIKLPADAVGGEMIDSNGMIIMYIRQIVKELALTALVRGRLCLKE